MPEAIDYQEFKKYGDPTLLHYFEFYSYNHALEILATSYPNEWAEIQDALMHFRITLDDITAKGGNESEMPRKIDDILYPYGWREIRISGDLVVKRYARKISQRNAFEKEPYEQDILEGYVDGHNIDFLKGKVALDFEWNSKDQTFDRDLLAMRTYYDCGVITVGAIITRSAELNDIFNALGKDVKKKYGSSTTWMGKLLYRLESRRNGGCPILAIGIKKECVVYEEGQLG